MIYLCYAYEWFPVVIYVYCGCVWCLEVRSAHQIPGLELRTVLSCHVGGSNLTWSFCESSHVLLTADSTFHPLLVLKK